jgi:hypothetical protein
MLAVEELENIVGRLRSLARDGGSMDAVQIKLIGLDDIRVAAGAAWPKLSERVREGSMHMLARRLHPNDVVLPAGDGFLVIFAEGGAASCEQRCDAMRRALLEFYLGDEGLSALRPEIKPRVLSGEGLTDLLAHSISRDGEPRTLGGEIEHVRLFMTRDQRIGARMASPVSHQRGGLRMCYDPEFVLDGRHHGEPDYLDLDIHTLDAALAAHATARERGENSFYGVTIHASTMSRRRLRDEYLSFWRRTPALLKRSMFVVIAEIERGTPLLSLVEWNAALRPHITRVGMSFHWSDHAITNLRASGAWSAGFHLPIYAGAQKPGRSDRLLEQVRFWSKALHGQGVRLMVDGFQDPDFLAQSATLGVDIATSDQLWPFSDGAFGARRARDETPSHALSA